LRVAAGGGQDFAFFGYLSAVPVVKVVGGGGRAAIRLYVLR